ncbi:MAG: hypothetical protein JW871_06250 [Endomicrobiales bacterium]|nr:hypothetical protein [Endomicrobiales bacterium]
MRLKKLVFIPWFLVFCFFSSVIYAESTYIIDSPTTGILDYGAYNLDFRLFSEGGVLTRLNFGVFRTINLGFGWEMKKVIGTQDISVSPPALALKIKLYEGGMKLPALVLGYDGQGYFYDNDAEEFTQKEKGIFLVAGRELFFPGFRMNIGGNMADFKTNTLYGFVNASINLEEKFELLMEYDNINCMPKNRLNVGGRIFIADYLSVDLAGRDIGAAGRDAERIVRINYLGRF